MGDNENERDSLLFLMTVLCSSLRRPTMDPQILTDMPVQAVQHPFVFDKDGVLKIRVGKGPRESTHPRMDCTKLYTHITAHTSPTGQPETDAAFYSAQLVHYGIPGDSNAERAMKALLVIFKVKKDGTAVLHVPENIRIIERKLKKQYKILLAKSKLVDVEQRKAAELLEKMKALKAEQCDIRKRDLEIDIRMRVLEKKTKQVRQNLANLNAVERDQMLPEKVEDLEEPEPNANEVDTESINESSDELEDDMDNEPDLDLESETRRVKGHAKCNPHKHHEPDSDQDTVDTDSGNDSSDVSEDEPESETMEDSVSRSRPANRQAEPECPKEEMKDDSTDNSEDTSSGESDDSDSDLTDMSSLHESDTHPKRKAKYAAVAPSDGRASKRTRISDSATQSEATVEKEAGPKSTAMSHSVRVSPSVVSDRSRSAGSPLTRKPLSDTPRRFDSNPPSAHSALEHQRRKLLKKTSGTWTISTRDGNEWVSKPDFHFSVGKCFQTGSVDQPQDSSAKIKQHHMMFRFGNFAGFGCAIANGELVNCKLKLVFTWRTMPAYDANGADERKFVLFFDKHGDCEGYVYGSTYFTEGFAFCGKYLVPLASQALVVDFCKAYFAIPRLGNLQGVKQGLLAQPSKGMFAGHDTTPQAALNYLVDRFNGNFTIISPIDSLWAGLQRPSISVGRYCGRGVNLRRDRALQDTPFVGRITSDRFRAYIVADNTPNISHLSEGGLKMTFTWRTPKEETADGIMAEGKLELVYNHFKRQTLDGFLTGGFLNDPIPMQTHRRKIVPQKGHIWLDAFHGCVDTSAKTIAQPRQSQRALQKNM